MAWRDKRQLGEAFGLSNFGVNLNTLAPGAMSALRHAHSRKDEFVYIFEGEATLVTDAGKIALTPGMCAGFRAGTGDAHHLKNQTDAPVAYLEIGDRSAGDQPVWPDVDLQLLDAGGKRVFAHRDGRLCRHRSLRVRTVAKPPGEMPNSGRSSLNSIAPSQGAPLWLLGEKRQRRACRCRSDVDDLVVGDAGLLERIAIQNGVKFGTFHCSGQDEPANARALRSGEQKVAGGIVLAQPDAVSSNIPVDLGQRNFVAKDDGVHAKCPGSACDGGSRGQA